MPSHTPQFMLGILVIGLLIATPAIGTYKAAERSGVEDVWWLRTAAAGGLAIGMVFLGLLYPLMGLAEQRKHATTAKRSLGRQFLRSWSAATGVLFVLFLMIGPAVIVFLGSMNDDSLFMAYAKFLGTVALSIAIVVGVSNAYFWHWVVPRDDAKRAAQEAPPSDKEV